MKKNRNVGIIGVGQSVYSSHREEVNQPEMIHEAVVEALDLAGLRIDDIDCVLHGNMELFEMIHQPDLWHTLGTGAYGKETLRVTTGGTTGATLACAADSLVASGLHDVVLAVASQRVGETLEAQLVLNTAVDPVYERGFGVGAIAIAAIQACSHMHAYDTTEEDLALISVRNHENALNNPYAHLRIKFSVEDALGSPMLSWPLHLSDCCPSSDGACAIILASEEKARKLARQPAWITGAGQITDNYFAGDRAWYEDWDSLAMLARRVYRLAKIDDPMRELDVAELYNPFTIQEILEYEALGFCEPGKGAEMVRQGVTAMDGQLPVCPSGGVLSTNPIGASGLIRVAEAALQVMGKADQRQVPNVKTALAHAWGATIGFHTLMILDREAP